MYRVSVIMPVQNNEKTLRRAIDSILKQTIYDLELILINDGSTDASAQICEEYANKEPLIVEVIHQQKRGLSVALNRGLFKASGTYVYFADPRDVFDHKMLEANYQLGIEKEAEMVVFGFTNPSVKNTEGGFQHLPNIPHLLTQEDFRDHYRNFHHFYAYELRNKLYALDYIKKQRIKFYKVPLKEAVFFNLSLYKEMDKVAINRVAYCTHDISQKKVYQKDLYEVNKEILSYLKNILATWGRTVEFEDIIHFETFQMVVDELKNIHSFDAPFTVKEKETVLENILMEEETKQAINQMKLSSISSPFSKALLAAFQNENVKAALQLWQSKIDTKKKASKISRLIKKFIKQ